MNFSKVSNEDLYQMCLRGDEPAWGFLYNYVRFFVRKLGWDLHESLEDITQGILGHLLEKGIDQLKEQAAFRGYVKRVAVNYILDNEKKKRVKTVSLNDDCDDSETPPIQPVSPGPGPEEQKMGAELGAALTRAINSLAQSCQEVLEAYIDYKMGVYKDYQSLAAALGKAVGTVSSQVKRCIDQLRMHQPLREWLEC